MTLATNPTGVRLAADFIFKPNTGKQVWNRLFQVTTLGIQPQSASDSITGVDCRNFNQTLDTQVTADDTLLTMVANQFNGYGLAVALGGREDQLLAAAGVVIADEVIGFGNGAFTIPRQDISAGSVVIQGADITVDDATGFAANQRVFNAAGVQFGTIQSVASLVLTVILCGAIPANSSTISNANGDTAVVSTSTPDNAVFTVTTDYTVDTSTTGCPPLITPVVGGLMAAMTNLDALRVNYTYDQYEGSQVVIGTETQFKGAARLIGRNVISGKKVFCELREVTFAPNAAFNLKGDDRATATWQGTIATPAGFSDPGFVNLGL